MCLNFKLLKENKRNSPAASKCIVNLKKYAAEHGCQKMH